MKYKVYCVINTPKNRSIMKVIELDARNDGDAVKRAEDKFNKYLNKVGYSVHIVMYEPQYL